MLKLIDMLYLPRADYYETFFTDYEMFAIFAIIALILSCVFFLLSYTFGTFTTILDTSTLSAYECGFDPFLDSRQVVDLKFHIIAVLFVIFDIEIALFIPWSVVVSDLLLISSFIYINIFIFLVILTIGLFYEYKNQIFDWNAETIA